MTQDETALFDAIEATWPAANLRHVDPWLIRDGKGGGKRVSAASAIEEVSSADVDLAEQEMRALDQQPLFMIRDKDAALDALLEARGYRLVDPVTVLVAPIETLTDIAIPPVTTFAIWEPLAIMAEIWAAGGIGPARLDVMARTSIKTGILARWNEKPAGVAFAAVHENIAMVHAVETLNHQRRQGVAQWIMRAAAFWGQEQGADTLAVLCTKANTAAIGLYSSLGFVPAGQYHYRMHPQSGAANYG